VTKCCSDYCAKRLYKLKQREKKITVVVVKEERKQKQKTVITEDEIKAIRSSLYSFTNAKLNLITSVRRRFS